MSLAHIYTRAQVGVEAPSVKVEVHIAPGIASFSIVGLPEAAVRESKDRVRSAIINAGLEFPDGHITVNLSPADLPKEGGRYDLPIALGLLVANQCIPQTALENIECIGELALSGEIRSVNGILPAVIAASAVDRSVLLACDNAQQAAMVKRVNIHAASHLLDILQYLTAGLDLPLYRIDPKTVQPTPPPLASLADVKGQYQAKRALQLAAAGGHHLLMVGPPGTGKTMLANRLCGLLPTMGEEQALEVAVIDSLCHKQADYLNMVRPFRSPHHTASAVALVGGGRPPKPGEISLAHNGVLFLDELPEFDRRVLEVLREPLESGDITISRAAYQMTFPAKFQLVAAMNPCPCGYFGDISDRCQCSIEQVKRYQQRLSGPLLDRIDIQVAVQSLKKGELLSLKDTPQPATAVPIQMDDLKAQIEQARSRQYRRRGKCNSQLSGQEILSDCALGQKEQQLLEQAMENLGFSARVCHKILKVARTIADMHDQDRVTCAHLSEALSYRQFDRIKSRL